MEEERLSSADKLLLTLHNLGVVHEKASKTVHELVQLTKISLEQLTEIIKGHEEAGYLSSMTNHEGSKHYFLTGRGIIRVSSIFT